MNRETWLNEMAARMAPRYAELGRPLPNFRVSIGFPSAGKDAPVSGECWDRRVSGDEHFEIFLNPGRDDSQAIAFTLAHELVHCAVGFKEGHKGEFARVARALGFVPPLTHAQEPQKATALAEWVAPMLEELGSIPHAAIALPRMGHAPVRRVGGGVAPVEAPQDVSGDEPSAEPINNRPPKQTTRLLKATCTAEDCGYTVRVTSKWLEIGPPHCPIHGAMGTANA